MDNKVIYIIDEFNPFNDKNIFDIKKIIEELTPSKIVICASKKCSYKTNFSKRNDLINIGLKDNIENNKEITFEIIKFKKLHKIKFDFEKQNFIFLNEFFILKINEKKNETILRNLKFIYLNNAKNILNILNYNDLSSYINKYKFEDFKNQEEIRNLHCYLLPLDELKYITNNKLYFAKNVKNYYKKKRYQHALSVADLSSLIALNNNLDVNIAYLSGYLHDIGKELAKNKEAVPIMNKYYLSNSAYPQFSWHQFIGEYILKKVFNVTDERITLSVLYHTTGRANMTQYEKIVFSADKLDPLRGYDSKYFIDECIKNLDVGFVKTLKNNKDYLEDGNKLEDNPLTTECYNYYLGE